MKFIYYIVSMIDGNVTGTDDGEVAEQLRDSEEHFVIEPEKNKWLQLDGEDVEIEMYGI